MKRFDLASKFWEAETKGNDLRIRFGKLGSQGQLKLKTLASPAAAEAEMAKVIAEKLKKGYVEAGGKKTASVVKKVSGVKPTQLKITELSVTGSSSPRLTALVDDEHGHVAIGIGNGAYASSDGKRFYRRQEPSGNTWGLRAIENNVYAMGRRFSVSKDGAKSWKSVTVPNAGSLYALLRDSKGTCWLGADDGVVFTSDHLERGWKKATFKAPGKVLAFAEIDAGLFIVGAGCAAWDGKKLVPLKGVSKTERICRITETPSGGIVLVGNEGVSYRSDDRGKSFKKTKSGVKAHLEDCAWVAGSLFVVGGLGSAPVVLRSDDEGKSFKKVPFKANDKLSGITSWGDGALLSGDRGVYALAAPNDPYWKGTKNRFKPEPPKLDALFTPNTARTAKDRESTYQKLVARAIADHARISAKQRSQRAADANAKLAQAVDEGAEGAEAVYADWLSDAGDPRGELAQIQLRLAKDPKHKELKKAEKALLERHAATWLGKLADVRDMIALEWSAGFITKARLTNTYARDPDFGTDEDKVPKTPATVEQGLAWLLASPSGRFLRDLTVGIVTFSDNTYGAIAKELSKHYLPALRSLYLGDFLGEETELNWSDLGKIEPMYAAMPNLERLKLRSGSIRIGTLVLPHLKEFEVVTGGLDSKSMRDIAAAVWPSLEKLSVQIGPEGESVKLEELQPILDGDNLPHLTHLGIPNFNLTAQLVEPLATSRILPQLTELDLSMGTLGDDSVAKLFAMQKAFAHLAKIDVNDNFITSAGKSILKQAKLAFHYGEQRDDDGDPGDRYASAYE
jgi:uncharacterized protein (TIGR02996 family)